MNHPASPIDTSVGLPSAPPTAAGAAAPASALPIPREELVAALNELLEAERAGARVAMESGREAGAADVAALVHDIHEDEVRWCGMLMRTIRAIDGAPSSTTGAFWGKAMAITDLEQRLLFLNRGQAWVVRRLEGLIPRVGDAAVRAELGEMLAAHRQNIDRVEVRAQALGLSPARTAG